jgi:3-oxoacyl-[acyl-carrier protein] reductase
MPKFENKIIVVTGGTRGIGASVTKNFLAEGATVIATYLRNDEAAQAFKTSLGELAKKLELRKFDVSLDEEVKVFYQWLEENHQGVSVLVNNSGIRKDNAMAMMPTADWDAVLNTNLRGAFLMSKYAVPLMMGKRFGRIINMSSVGGEIGLVGQANYAASKAGMVAMAKVLSKEVARKGITVNNICPGFIETELLLDLTPEQKKEYSSQVPMRRFGTGEEVSAAVLFLASEAASYITGSTIEVDGGL